MEWQEAKVELIKLFSRNNDVDINHPSFQKMMEVAEANWGKTKEDFDRLGILCNRHHIYPQSFSRYYGEESRDDLVVYVSRDWKKSDNDHLIMHECLEDCCLNRAFWASSRLTTGRMRKDFSNPWSIPGMRELHQKRCALAQARPETRKRHSESNGMHDLEVVKKVSAAVRITIANRTPEERNAILAKNKASHNTPEYLEAASARAIERCQDPEFKAKHRAAVRITIANRTPEERNAILAKNKASHNTPEYLAFASEHNCMKNAEVREKQARNCKAALEKHWLDPVASKKHKEARAAANTPELLEKCRNIQCERSARWRSYQAANGPIKKYHEWCKAGQPSV